MRGFKKVFRSGDQGFLYAILRAWNLLPSFRIFYSESIQGYLFREVDRSFYSHVSKSGIEGEKIARSVESSKGEGSSNSSPFPESRVVHISPGKKTPSQKMLKCTHTFYTPLFDPSPFRTYLYLFPPGSTGVIA